MQPTITPSPIQNMASLQLKETRLALLDEELAALRKQRAQLRQRINCFKKKCKDEVKAKRPAVEQAIDAVYHYLWNSNGRVDHTGGGTYAELTFGNVERLIDMLQQHVLPNLTEEERKGFSMLDAGGGFMTCLAHIAQKIEGYYFGVEYDESRAWMFAFGWKRLLESKLLINANIAYLWQDLFDVKELDVDVLYMFDEAFPYSLVMHMVELFAASSKCKYLISFKVAKAYKGYTGLYNDVIDVGKVKEVARVIGSKKGGELSTAVLFVKHSFLEQKELRRSRRQSPGSSNDYLFRECRPFFKENLRLKAVEHLLTTVANASDNDRKARQT